MRRRRQKNDLPKILMLSGVLVTCMGGLGYAAFSTMGQKTPDQYGCFDDAQQHHTVVLADSSEPRLNEQQRRSVHNYLDELYDNLGFNEKLSFITTEGDQISSLPKARFHVCGVARSSEELEDIGAASASVGYLKKQKQRLYDKVFAPQIEALLSSTPDEARKQNAQSPVLEMIKGISNMRDFGPGSRLIVLSDLLQNSDSAQFCVTQGHMPPFLIFREREIYQQRLVPRSMDGVDITVLLLQRYGYGQRFLKYCKNEEELTKFWRDYFVGNGAVNPEFIRIRSGHTGG
ncbi:MAG: hypothetical protein H6937_02565 [Burkholderiales bacterium]|nr:hypothetical protein [Burkholderiales bacterium]